MGMTPTPFRETGQWKKGHSGELLVAKILQERGWYIIPSYDYSGEDGNKAPRLQGLKDGLVIPDLDIAQNGRRRWAEVKTKAAATYTRITKRLEHGIPIRHYNDYQRVQEITGCDVWLFIYEEDTGAILHGKLNALSEQKRTYEGHKMSRGGMVFFPRDAFKPFAIAPR